MSQDRCPTEDAYIVSCPKFDMKRILLNASRQHRNPSRLIKCTFAKFIMDGERLQIAALVSFEIDKPRRAAILSPRKILAASNNLHHLF